MEINDLMIFLKVAQLGSISKAAEELGYVQPNITGRLKILEGELNTLLFRRTNKGVVLLPSGELLVEYATKIIQTVEEAKEKIQNQHPILRVGATQTISKMYLTPMLLTNQPLFSLYMRTSEELRSLLKVKEVDLVITNQNWQDAGIKKMYSFTEEIGWIGSKTSDFSTCQRILINQSKTCPYREATLNFLKKNQTAKQMIELDSLDTMLSMIESGNGMAILPISFCTTNIIAYPRHHAFFDPIQINIYAAASHPSVLTHVFLQSFRNFMP